MAGGSKEYKLAIKIHGEMAKSLPKSVQLTKSELRAIAKEASITSQSMNGRFRDGLKSTEGIFNSIGRAGVKAFTTVTKASATAAAAVATASVKVGTEYESQMSTVKAISGATASEFQALTEEAKHLGATTVFTAKEAGQAMEYEAMAGWKSSQMIKGTQGIMNLAAASGEELASTSDIVTDSLTAFNLKAKDAAHFSDVLASTSTNSNTNVAKMGKTFEYVAPVAGSLGYSIEDTSLAIGIMANSGIKASKSGTALRGWLSRMAKPTKETAAAMDKLNLSLTDSDGKTKSLRKIMKETRTAFSSLTKEQKSQYAAMLAGRTGMSGLLAITNASEKDFKKLNQAIRDCDGAAEEMANIRLDNLEGDVKLFTSALEGAGIDIYEELKEPLRELVQGATEWVGDFSKEFKTGFPSAIREVKAAAAAVGEFAEPLLSVGEWLLDNPDVIVGTITGIGTAIVSYKVVSGLTSLASGLASLGPAGAAVLGIGGAVAVISGINAAMIEAEREAAARNLSEHFGDVALSMEDLDVAARKIIGNGYLSQLEELMASLDKGDEFIDSMNEAMQTIRLTNWKVEAGIKLKKGDLNSYKGAVNDYIDDVQEYISNQGYTVSVATKFLFGDDAKKINLRNNQWYEGLSEEAAGIKKDLKNYLKDAVKDGLDIKEQEVVNNMLDSLNKISEKIANAQQKARMDVLDAKYDGVEMDSDSFQNLQKELSDNVQKSNEEADEAFETYMASIRGQRSDGKLSKKEFRKEKKDAKARLYEAKAKATLNAQNFMLGKIEEKYGDEINPVIEDAKAVARQAINAQPSWTSENEKIRIAEEATSYYLDNSNISKEQKEAIDQLMQYVNLTGNELDAIVSQVEKSEKKFFDKELYRKIQNSESKRAEINAVNYETNTKYGLTGFIQSTIPSQFLNSDSKHDNFVSDVVNEEYKNAYKAIEENLQISFGKGFGAGKKEADLTKSEIEKTYTDPIEIAVHVSDILYDKSSPFYPAALSHSYRKPVDKKVEPKKHALGGIFHTPHIGMVAEAGFPEAAIPIKRDARSIGLWEETGRMLGVLGSRNKERTFPVLEKKISSYASSGINMSYRSQNTESDQRPIEIQYSPKIIIQGNADKDTVQRALDDGYSNFEKYMNQYMRKKGRLSFASN